MEEGQTVLEPEEFLVQYDEMLDECYPVIKIGYSEFYASTVLKECDPIAYRVGAADYADSLAEDGILVKDYTD
jgi:hypothetical protein